MRRVLLLLVLIVTAAPLAAQSAADRALIDRVTTRLNLARQADNMRTGMAGLPGGVLTDSVGFQRAVRDSVAASFAADLRPDLLREALAYLESESYREGQVWAARLTTPEAQAAILDAVLDPKKGVLGDSLAAEQFLATSGLFDAARLSAERVFRALFSDVPVFAAEREREGIPLDALMETTLLPILANLRVGMVAGVRFALARVPAPLIADELAYSVSPAGRYVAERTREGLLAGAIPQFVAHVRAATEADLGPPPPPAPVSSPDDVYSIDVFDVVDQEPVLIGGLEELTRQVVYPEAARRASVEGTVYVQFVVDERGTVRNAEILRSPDGDLSTAALAAVNAVRFEPGRHQGQAVKVRYRLPIRFTLTDRKPRNPLQPPADGE